MRVARAPAIPSKRSASAMRGPSVLEREWKDSNLRSPVSWTEDGRCSAILIFLLHTLRRAVDPASLAGNRSSGQVRGRA